MSNEGFTTSTWAGKPRFQCVQCAFDTTSIAAMRDHARLAHVRQPAAPAPAAEAEAAPADETPATPEKVQPGKTKEGAES